MSENKISIEELNKAIAEDFEPVIEVEWRGLTLRIKKCLSLEEMMTFVSNVVSSCFAANTNEYLPEIKDFTTRCCILENYAGIVLPKSLNEKYEMVYSCDIVSAVAQHIEPMQFNAMLAAIDRKIEHQAQSNIEAMNKQMNEVIAGFSALEKNLSGIFGGIDNETITKIAGAIADGKFDENKLAKAFTNNVSSDKADE
ncbi:MAG: hypothetical protein K2F81_08420 [Ruminococcus sp.]|nr:hypothetical protein [Ruminococcus sp.]